MLMGRQGREDAAAVVVPVAVQPGAAEMHEARETFRRAVEREEEIRAGNADISLGIEGAAASRDAAQEERDRLMRQLARGAALGPDALAETKAATREAEAAIAAAEAMLGQRRELLQLAEEQTREAYKRLEQVLRREVATAEREVDARMAEKKRVWQQAEGEFHALNSAKTDAGQLLRGGLGYRATVTDLERMLTRMAASL